MTAPQILAKKQKGEKIVCLTAYDYTSGLISDSAGVDLILVGDSLGTVIQGHNTTTKVTLDEISYHVRLTRHGVNRALLVADLPLGSYGSTVGQGVDSAVQLVRAGAEAVKLENDFLPEIEAIVKVGIPVMGHIGMTPQSVNNFGGHKVQGKGGAFAGLINKAKSIESAGAFAIVLELVTTEAAKAVTEAVKIPTIGIGAGPHCDGQIQVFHDLVGLWPNEYRHAKRYSNGFEDFGKAVANFSKDVRELKFPTEENSF